MQASLGLDNLDSAMFSPLHSDTNKEQTRSDTVINPVITEKYRPFLLETWGNHHVHTHLQT